MKNRIEFKPMNIFILSKNPEKSAEYMCDKHIPKMVVETAQMLACALYANGVSESEMPLTSSGTHYKGGYKHHPCSKWAGESNLNYAWLCLHGLALCRQFMLRYKKVHTCTEAIVHMCNMADRIKEGDFTPFHQAMPEKYHNVDPVKAYRNYYIAEKTFAEWKKGVPKPKWFYN